ncbi:MAG: hypothetical protein LBL17_00375 [Coxiellaceae bacterium]|jgi:hypothetical protein|nr:hypothetical protein [Coxiellaceae bacterium]
MLNSKGRLKCLLLSLVSIIIFYVVLSGGRKAAMVDMLITFSLYIYYIIRNAKYVTKSKVAVILSVLFLSVIGIYVGIVKGGGLFSTLYREVFFSRGRLYVDCVLEIAKRSFIEIFTGSVIYWSSQHNILLAFLYQIGLFGVIVFLLAFSYFVNSLLLILKQRFSNISKKNGTLCKDVKMWATFAFYSFISSNMFNSNFQLPYFVINVSFISLCYLYFYKDSSVMVTTKLGPLER